MKTAKMCLVVVSFVLCSALCVGADNWAVKVPSPPDAEQREAFGYGMFDYQTTFCEAHLGSHAPVNNQTSIGVRGTVPLPFNYLMRSRYSEFDMVFGILGPDGREVRPYVLEDFAQTSPGDWLPG